MQLTPHFSLEELVFSSTAERLRIDNSPPDWALPHLRVLAEGLERVRELLGGHPIHVDSGYRCLALNRAVVGAWNSAHTEAYAADILVPGFGPPAAVARAIAQGHIGFDQLILEGTWTHISFSPAMRRELLTAHFGPGGTTYTPGLNS